MTPKDILELGKRKFQEAKLSSLAVENKVLGSYNGVKVSDVLKEVPKASWNTGKNILQGAAKSVLTAGSFPLDIYALAKGKEPMQPVNVPGVGEVPTLARQAIDIDVAGGRTGLSKAAALSSAIGTFAGGVATAAGIYDYGKTLMSKLIKPKATGLKPQDSVESNLKTSGHDYDKIVEKGELKKSDIFNADGSWKLKEGQAHNISDLAGKLNEKAPGVGDLFQNQIDPSKAYTPDQLDDIAIQTWRLMKNTHVENIPVSQIQGISGLANQANITKSGLESFSHLYPNQEIPAGAFHGARIGREVESPIILEKVKGGTFRVIDGWHRLRQILMNDKGVMDPVKGSVQVPARILEESASSGAAKVGTILGGAAATGAGVAANMPSKEIVAENKFTDAPKEQKEQTFVEPVRQIPIKQNELEELKYTLFAEISNRSLDKQLLEAKTIINTALNRVKKFGTTLEYELSKPKQYQGYGSEEYWKAKKGNLDAPSKKKMAAVEAAIKLLLSGMMDDNTQGARYYIHQPSGEIRFGHEYPVK